jgi:hypothetical protein
MCRVQSAPGVQRSSARGWLARARKGRPHEGQALATSGRGRLEAELEAMVNGEEEAEDTLRGRDMEAVAEATAGGRATESNQQ